MLKWVISGVLYVGLVIGGYSLYSFYAEDEKADHHGDHQVDEEENQHHEEGHEEEHGDDHGEHGDHGDAHGESEVIPSIEKEGNKLTVTLHDLDGNVFDDLKVTHEKLMHLIIVKEDLETFIHLHPEKVTSGTFQTNYDLEEGMYKVYVDIKPNEKSYGIAPMSLMVGDHHHHGDPATLEKESDWVKVIGDYEVELDVSSFSMKDHIVLSFNINGGEPEPYLGALGHVVIIDEVMEEFIHVHPSSKELPVFEAHFSKPGMYKLWAEFKLDGTVYAFPFVLEITE
ncbi:hypothetical protein [Bacillus sp. FJAT-45066]|uniref:hypothetical protein n=1 Tax=Bacillus sp. FJAT-45066 TaxID=2011010 RepID=UPI000BB6799C|nr:hypothetical protein [Bacillus sp. FJAT-45066]